MRGAARNRLPGLAFVLVLLVGGFLQITGCGSDTTVDTIRGTRLSLLNIKNGIWAVEELWTYAGPGTCGTRPDSTVADTTAKCDVGFLSPFQIVCDTMTVGDTLFFDCTGTANLDPCYLHLNMTGSGTVTDSTFSLTAVQVQDLTAREGELPFCEDAYGTWVNACTTYIAAEGTWLDTLTTEEKDLLCPDDDDNPFFPSGSPGTITGP
jgi:hypothetical protein